MSSTRKPTFSPLLFSQAYYHPSALPAEVYDALTKGKPLSLLNMANAKDTPAENTRSKFKLR